MNCRRADVLITDFAAHLRGEVSGVTLPGFEGSCNPDAVLLLLQDACRQRGIEALGFVSVVRIGQGSSDFQKPRFAGYSRAQKRLGHSRNLALRGSVFEHQTAQHKSR